MARSSIYSIANDLIDDSGSVLWSFVKGEQLEYPVTLEFLPTTRNYIYEAVVVEAANILSQASPPTVHKEGGVQTILTVRVPTSRGVWDAGQAYNTNEVVQYSGKSYFLKYGIARTYPISPDIDPMWEETLENLVYLQFPAELASTWEVPALVGSPIYGFFELRVTEPPSPGFRRTWKPVRGMVEILFSPTDIVPDQ